MIRIQNLLESSNFVAGEKIVNNFFADEFCMKAIEERTLMTKFIFGLDALRGNTRSHPEHDG